MDISLHYSLHPCMLVWVEIDMYCHRLVVLQRLVFPYIGEERLAVHKIHIIQDPPRDRRISIVSVGREEDDLVSTITACKWAKTLQVQLACKLCRSCACAIRHIHALCSAECKPEFASNFNVSVQEYILIKVSSRLLCMLQIIDIFSSDA